VLTIATVNLFRPVGTSKLDSVSSDVASIIREAQNKAMNTDTSGQAVTSEYGIHFETNKYTLFIGSVFNSNDTNNLVVDAPSQIVITPNLPCQSLPNQCNNIVFQKVSGEVIGFDGSKNSVCLTETVSNDRRLVRINFLGVADVQEGC
jgi:hypothetical protein